MEIRAGVATLLAGHGYDWLEHEPGGPAWREAAPRLVAEAVERWGLRLGEAFGDAFESVVFDARAPDGDEVVLKVHFTGRENEHEADALAAWAGRGAVTLLARDDALGALLLERCRPGVPLSTLDGEAALDAVVDLLPQLWIAADSPFRSLVEEAGHWSRTLEADWQQAGRPFARRYVDAALEALALLPPTQGEHVLVHQDLHGENILAAERRPWLAIDPKPLLGEREFSIAPIVRSFELGHERRLALRRLDRLAAELGLDRERALGWTVGQTVAWSVGSEYSTQHIETVGWLLGE